MLEYLLKIRINYYKIVNLLHSAIHFVHNIQRKDLRSYEVSRSSSSFLTLKKDGSPVQQISHNSLLFISNFLRFHTRSFLNSFKRYKLGNSVIVKSIGKWSSCNHDWTSAYWRRWRPLQTQTCYNWWRNVGIRLWHRNKDSVVSLDFSELSRLK